MKYIRTYQPKLTIIHSTVPPYTTSKITSSNNFSLIVHSPVRGMHNDMLKDLKRYIKFIGPTTPKSAIEAKKHLEEIGFVIKVLSNASETELGKLLETSYVGGMIALWQEMERISRNLGINFVKSSEILRDTDAIRQDRPMWYPDEIGGHCIMPNIILLLESCRNYNVHSFIFPEVCQSNAKIQIERMHRNPILEKTIDDMKELFKKSRKSRNG
jgi:UDP-N-acetyl-D-mannosaminuronate dehydrogenase